MAIEITPNMIFVALLGGILPAVFWLWFWVKEDKLHPEPRGLIILAFLAGMLATAAAYPVEKEIRDSVSSFASSVNMDMTLLFLWAVTEEVLKFLAIYIIALRSKYFDEPIDAVLYLVTIALGFAALENAMFLINPLNDGDAIATILLGNFRFIGATLLHVAASGIVGVALALSFYSTRANRQFATFYGLIGAIVLHTVFNFSILASEGVYLREIFIGLWVFIVGILLVCEKIKKMAPRSHVEYPHTGTIIIPLRKL
jgi:RsiW-degrading membrane proteinase PrsW (M82 family)